METEQCGGARVTVADEAKSDTLLNAALLYASRGLRVFPLHTPIPVVRPSDGSKSAAVICSCRKRCENVGKHPRTKGGLKDASSDEQVIRAWWKQWPNANVGVCTGRGLLVVDIDADRTGRETLDDLVGLHGELPETVEALTGGGGSHLFFSYPADRIVPNGVDRLGPGVDIRADGGYVVAPPSLHKSGKTYLWEVSSDFASTPIAPAPAWILTLASQRRTGGGSTGTGPHVEGEDARGGGHGAPPDAVHEGGRNDTLYRLACSLRSKGLGRDAILAALLVENAKRCVPPLDEVEVERLVDSACRHEAGHSAAYERSRTRTSNSSGAESEAASETDASEVVFFRGDSVEIGERLAQDLREGSTETVVFDRDSFWRYDGTLGVWTQLERSVVFTFTSQYAGLPVGPKRRPLTLSEGSVWGAVRAAENFCARPGFFNAAPKGIVFTNGFVRVDGGKIVVVDHAPEHRAIHALPFAFEENLRSAMWDDFLEEVFAKASEDERAARASFLSEHAGACLMGLATQYAVALVLLGNGNDGKSTYLDVLRALFPRGAVGALAPQEWSNRFYLAEMAGIRVNLVGETPEKEIGDSELFKTVISGDELTVARKFRDPFKLVPEAGHVFAANTLPLTRDLTKGFWRRVEVIAFDREFGEHERKVGFSKSLVATELPAVAAWAIRGAAALQARGVFAPPSSSKEAKESWRQDSDQVAQWLDECTEPDERGHMGPAAAFDSYVLWCKHTLHAGMTRGRFWRRLSKLCTQHSNGSIRYYQRRIKAQWVFHRTV